jgi:Tfp pilus assembly protein PilF
MGIIVHDTIYCPRPVSNAYVKIDPILTINRKNKTTYDVIAHYCCYKSEKEQETPFHKVEITLKDLPIQKTGDLNNIYGKLYVLIKSDFINTSDVE